MYSTLRTGFGGVGMGFTGQWDRRGFSLSVGVFGKCIWGMGFMQGVHRCLYWRYREQAHSYRGMHFKCRSEPAPDGAGLGNTKTAGIKKGHPRMAFKKLERFFTYTAATGRM